LSVGQNHNSLANNSLRISFGEFFRNLSAGMSEELIDEGQDDERQDNEGQDNDQ